MSQSSICKLVLLALGGSGEERHEAEMIPPRAAPDQSRYTDTSAFGGGVYGCAG